MIAGDLAVDRSGRLADRFYDRAMFPIHDEQGRTIAFGGRVMGDAKPKYLNTKETPVFHKGKHLFAFDRAKETMAATGEAIVCEGYTDVIAMHEAGFTNAVAALGTAFRIDHIRLMERQRVSSHHLHVRRRCRGPAGGRAGRPVHRQDHGVHGLRGAAGRPGSGGVPLARRRLGHEAELDAAGPLIDFVFTKRLAGYDLSAPGRRVKALDEMAQLLAPLKNSVLLDEYATQLADALGMDVAETKRVIREKPIRPLSLQRRREAAPATRTAGWQAPAADEARARAVPADGTRAAGPCRRARRAPCGGGPSGRACSRATSACRWRWSASSSPCLPPHRTRCVPTPTASQT